MAAEVLKKRPRFILVSDLDWTMVDHKDRENAALNSFNKLWKDRFAKDCLLVFSTGRSHALFTELATEVPLLVPDVLVCSVGTEIFYEGLPGREAVPDSKWTQRLDQGWQRKAIVDAATAFPGLTLQAQTEQRPHKISFRLSLGRTEAEGLVEKLRETLLQRSLPAKVIYSGGEDLDILPQHASKGKGLEFLLQEIRGVVGDPPDGVLVNGDSGNDIELFEVPGVRGTVVSNAHPELREWAESHPSPHIFEATKRCAGGIVEALEHFKLVS